jgi:hypothetical protein
MLTILTVYTYVLGEITNTVMSGDTALVNTREEVAKVQTFVAKHSFPRELSKVRS